MLDSASNITKLLLDILEITFVGVVVFALTYLFIGQPLEITGDSMSPTFLDGEQIVAEKISGAFADVQRGDIVVFNHPEQEGYYVIKRVVGLPDEMIRISNGRVFINGSTLQEDYLEEVATEGYGELLEDIDIKIPEKHYVLLGDNRGVSTDSRKWGFIPEEEIVAKSLLVYYPIGSVRISDSDIGVQLLKEKLVNLKDKALASFE